MTSIWEQWASNPLYGKLAGDTEFTSLTPAFQQAWRNILFKYGDTTDSQGVLAGPDGSGNSSVAANPYSIMANLLRGRVAADHGTANAANAAGLEESGAAAAGFNANNQQLLANQSAARQAETSELGSALGGYAGSVGSIFGRLEANPTPAAPPDTSAALPASYVPPAPYNPPRAGAMPGEPGGGGPDPWGIKSTKVPKPKPISFADALHGAGRF